MAEENGRESHKNDRTEIRKGQREQGEEEEEPSVGGRDKDMNRSTKSLKGLGPLGMFPKGFLYPKFQANLESGRDGLR